MMKIKNINFFIIFSFLIGTSVFTSCGGDVPEIELIEPSVEETFTNPLLYGADPWVFQSDDTYYYLHTTGNDIRIWETEEISELASANSKVIYNPVAGSPNSKNIWAPEVFLLDDKWYVYYTAGNGEDINQRTWVLENDNADPLAGSWVDKGRIFNSNADFWAIDGTVMEYSNDRYFIWSGRPDVTNTDLTQNIYISKMSNPWTLEGEVTLLTEPEFPWEKIGFGVNEAPEILKGPNGFFMTYSASFCGTDDYALGMLILKQDGDPMKASDWTKSPQPVFSKSPANNAFGPGHNSFFQSPDGTENWIIYHANSTSGEGCSSKRNIRIQEFTFNAEGIPNFGEPVATGMKLDKPAG